MNNMGNSCDACLRETTDERIQDPSSKNDINKNNKNKERFIKLQGFSPVLRSYNDVFAININ